MSPFRSEETLSLSTTSMQPFVTDVSVSRSSIIAVNSGKLWELPPRRLEDLGKLNVAEDRFFGELLPMSSELPLILVPVDVSDGELLDWDTRDLLLCFNSALATGVRDGPNALDSDVMSLSLHDCCLRRRESKSSAVSKPCIVDIGVRGSHARAGIARVGHVVPVPQVAFDVVDAAGGSKSSLISWQFPPGCM